MRSTASGVHPTLRLRLAFDAATAALLLVALAYHWLGNVAHEVIGTAMFVLAIVHNVFNRRRYAGMARSRRETRGKVDIAVTLLLLATMLALLSTSVMISTTVLTGLGGSGGFTARRVHALAAYWALVIVSVHLGMRWPIIMGATRNLGGIVRASAARTIVLRVVAVAIALQGVVSSFELAIGTKMSMQMTLEWWDFEASVAGFFFHCLAVAGLYIVVTYYAVRWLRPATRDARGTRVRVHASN